MSLPPPPAGATLDRWLERLDAQGFRVGVRERLLVQSLLSRLAAQGELPTELHGMLMLAAGLLCTTREQQRRYVALLDDFVAAETAPPPAPPKRWHRPADAPPRFGVQMAVVAWALLLVLGIWLAHDQATAPKSQVEGPPDMGRYDGPPAPDGAAQAPAFYVPPLPLPLQPPLPPGWSTPVRAGVLLLGAVSALALLGAALSRRRRQMALQGVSTDDEVEQHLLHDAEPVDIAPHPVLARAVGRALRQRVAGEARTLDIGATLRATVAARGAFTPRWRELQRTPEYLVLVDTRHPADHHAACAHTLVDALSRAGVAVQVWAYDTTPDAGCWQRGGIGNLDATTRHRVPLATLATRAGGSRLLVFGPADVLLHPVTGDLQPWAAPLRTLPERAWITPVPLHAWGAAEQAADAAGFLVLPLQEAALNTLAGWFTSRRLTLALDTDTPLSTPALLRGSALDWVTRTDAPPPDTVQTLLQQLRRMLGATRYQWLCACAVFPALTPPLTLALGQHLVADPRALALGLSALSALPWFRYGHMPAWLRRELLQQLTPELRATLAAEVQRRLDSALDAGDGPVLADVATRQRRRLLALQQGRGPLRDVVLADFVREDTDPGLAQQLPEGLRRRLFKGGDSSQGWRPLVLALPAAAVVAALAAATPLWPALVGTVPQPALAALPGATLPDPRAGQFLKTAGEVNLYALDDGRVTAYGRDTGRGSDAFVGAELKPGGPATLPLVVVSGDKTASGEVLPYGLARAETFTSLGLQEGDTSAIGASIANGVSLDFADGRLQLRMADRALGAALDTGGARVVAAAFTPSGSRVAALLADGSIRAWGRPWPQLFIKVAACAADDPAASRAGDIARRLVSQIPQQTATEVMAVAGRWPRWKTLQEPGLPSSQELVAGNDMKLPLARGVLFRAETARPLAEALAQALSVDTVFGTAGPWSAHRIGSGNPTELVVQACEPVAAAASAPAPDVSVSGRVRALFAGAAEIRKAAAEALLRDREQLSDAVQPAVAAALAAQALRKPVVEPELSGIYNVLVMLQSAPPASLNRVRPELLRLLAEVRGHGNATATQAAQLQKKLDAIASQRPTVYLQIADEAQRPLAALLTQRLQANGLPVAGTENIGSRAPATTELRIQGYSDRLIARNLASASRAVLGEAARVVPLNSVNPANDAYEIWLDRDLCVTRMVSGCADAYAYASKNASPGNGPNAATLDLIARYEGATLVYTGPRQSTIGYGHLITPEEHKTGQLRIGTQAVYLAKGIDEPQARSLLAQDLLPRYAAIDKLVQVPLNDNQRGALASLVYNVGIASLSRSTLLTRINAGDYAGAGDELARWTTAANRELPGLQARRAAEAALWNTPPAAANRAAARKSAK